MKLENALKYPNAKIHYYRQNSIDGLIGTEEAE
jgi:hypothetical protein